MRFTTGTGQYTAPPPLTFSLNAASETHYKEAVIPSGESAEIVPEDPIKLKTLVISWQDVTVPGELHIGSFTLLQSVGGGQVVIPCHDIAVTGLRTVNNSYGGRYAVLVLYTENSDTDFGIGANP